MSENNLSICQKKRTNTKNCKERTCHNDKNHKQDDYIIMITEDTDVYWKMTKVYHLNCFELGEPNASNMNVEMTQIFAKAFVWSMSDYKRKRDLVLRKSGLAAGCRGMDKEDKTSGIEGKCNVRFYK